MASAFSEQEKIRIKRKVLEAGEAEFTRYGLQRARVEDIARNAGISKGSFYQFFPSKEELFLCLLEKLEKSDRVDMVQALAELPRRERLPALIDGLIGYLDKSPFLQRVFTGSDLAWLERKVLPERLKEHVSGDEVFMRDFVAASEPGIPPEDIERWAKALVCGFEAYLRAKEENKAGAVFLLRSLGLAWREEMHDER